MEPYQVFINHRGKDTKKNIASLIYHALEPYGLRVFLDQYVLCLGDTIETEIRRAISRSSIHIAIFSKNYGESRWCLDELFWMLKSSHGPKFIPIFCDVEPWELRVVHKGCYAEAFQKHHEREPMEVVDEWKDALRKAAGISGTVFNWKESDDYGKLLRDIANAVMEHVKPDPLEVAPHPVGLDQAWKDLRAQIEKERFKKVVVIAGLSGIGKSTLVRHIFNNLSHSEFKRASYLYKVRERDEHDLQRQLCCQLLGKSMLHSWTEGWIKRQLRNSLKGLKVLIVFDDVDDREKIESVVDLDAVEPGSLILITSRYKDILGGSSPSTFLYDVKPLKRNHAQELFCHHAFRQLNPPEKYEDLVENFLKICGGLPLCLEVLGGQVSRISDRAHWERQLKLYSQGASLPEANDVINKLLKWSCKVMDSEQQRMLLDVAYFLVGEDEELAVQVLEGLDYIQDVRYSLKRLCETYLINFKNDVDYHHDETEREQLRQRQRGLGTSTDWEHIMEKASRSLSAALTKRSSKLIMHNQVREMARYIVREDQSEPLRLRCAVDIEKQSASDSRPVRGICIREDQSPSQLPLDINITGITGVRLLLVEHSIPGLSTFLRSISGNLVWLRWRVSPFISLPSTISVRNLRVLELQGLQDVDLENFFSSIHERPLELRVVDINLTEGGASSSSSIIADPDDFFKSFDGNISSTRQFLQSIGSPMKNLNKIVLKGVIVERSLPFDFSELKMLRHLDLSGSSNLTALPNSFSQLLQLQHLALRDCRRLSIPVDILGEISTLEHIDFKGCLQLVHLPQGIVSQRRLRYLNLLETSLEELPLTLEPPYQLEQLIIGSNRFRELSCSVAFLGKLKELSLVGCFELEHISMPIEQLTCLERLEIYGSRLRILPAGISLLKDLKVLTIISCPIENFSLDNNVKYALTDLTLTHTAISDLSIPAGACPMLEIVDLSSNCRLSQVELSQSTLVKLNLEGCQNLQDMNLPKLGRLKFLNIKKCGYVAIQNVAECGSLEEITAEEYLFKIKAAWSQLEIYGSNLRILPAGISLLKHLKVLSIISCPIENFSLDNNVMDALTDLTLDHTHISDLSITSGACPRLKVLTIISCPIRNFSLDNNVMDALTHLTLTDTFLSDLSIPAGACPRLTHLTLTDTFLFDLSIPAGACPRLTHLTLTDTCISDLSIPAGACPRLKVLTIISSPIQNISLDNNALTHLTLTRTDISYWSIPAGACPMLEIVDLSHNCLLSQVELSQSTLVKLNLEGCENLQDVELSQSTLVQLNLEGCQKLQHMNLPKLGRLKFLNIKECRYVAIQNVAECGSLEEIRAEECRFTIEAAWSQLERPAWSQLQRLNFFTFSQYSYSLFGRRWKHLQSAWRIEEFAQEFEKFLNSFHGVTLREVPSTATDESPVVVEKVHSHSAILMCFITDNDDFVVRFEACNGGARSQEFVIRHRSGTWVHVYMWTQRSTLFTDEDNFYDNVSIYKKGIYREYHVECGGRGWILTFSREYHVLDVLNQIINPSAAVGR